MDFKGLAISSVRLIHFILLMSALIIFPVFGNHQMLVTYIYAIPLTMFHWVSNNDMCCLTALEMKLTGKTKAESFADQVFSPIYTPEDGNLGYRLKYIFITLWLITTFRILRFGAGFNIKLPGNIKLRI